MKYKVLIMSGLMLGGLGLLSCNQQGKPQQTIEAVDSEEVPEEEDVIISKDKDWSERVIVAKSNPVLVEYVDTLTLYRDGTATDVFVSSQLSSSQRGYWELGSFKRGDTEFPAIKITFSNEYSSRVYFMEADAHEGDFVYRKYEDMLRKTMGNEIVLEEVYR